jgi:hypothetical protein
MIREPGGLEEPAERTIDATGRYVTPGFIDVHTHYDAQLFWDPTASPSPLHGVTTVLAGNCGFSIAPLVPSEATYLSTMLARVEGIPIEALNAGVPWDWNTTADYFDRLDGTLAVNAGFMAGHSAIRRVVMGKGANAGPADADSLERMKRTLRECLEAGAIGFSSSWANTHNDAAGEMVHRDVDRCPAAAQLESPPGDRAQSRGLQAPARGRHPRRRTRRQGGGPHDPDPDRGARLLCDGNGARCVARRLEGHNGAPLRRAYRSVLQARRAAPPR